MKVSRRIIAEAIADGFVTDIENDTVTNTDFRRVLYTTKRSQLVLMSLKPNEDIGEETHPDTDQFIRVESGTGVVRLNGKNQPFPAGSSVVIPAGVKHNITNGAGSALKLYTIYTPPHHRDGVVFKTKKDANASREHFDGKTTAQLNESVVPFRTWLRL